MTAGALALAVCLAGGVAAAGAASAAEGFFDTRIAGDDRFGTAIAASKAAFPTTSTAVVVTSADATVDGLSASYAAGVADAPILYASRDAVSAATLAEITRLGAKKIVIVGGASVVSPAAEAQLAAVNGGATVTRYGGEDRYATAAQVALSNPSVKPNKVLIASGTKLADALALGPMAYKQRYPILLTEATRVPAATRDALATLNADFSIAAGGEAVISAGTAAELGVGRRLAGDDRQRTAVEIYDYQVANEQFESAVALVGSRDQNAADALVAAPVAAKGKVSVLFAGPGAITGITREHLISHARAISLFQSYVFGGADAVPPSTVAEAQAILDANG